MSACGVARVRRELEAWCARMDHIAADTELSADDAARMGMFLTALHRELVACGDVVESLEQLPRVLPLLSAFCAVESVRVHEHVVSPLVDCVACFLATAGSGAAVSTTPTPTPTPTPVAAPTPSQRTADVRRRCVVWARRELAGLVEAAGGVLPRTTLPEAVRGFLGVGAPRWAALLTAEAERVAARLGVPLPPPRVPPPPSSDVLVADAVRWGAEHAPSTRQRANPAVHELVHVLCGMPALGPLVFAQLAELVRVTGHAAPRHVAQVLAWHVRRVWPTRGARGVPVARVLGGAAHALAPWLRAAHTPPCAALRAVVHGAARDGAALRAALWVLWDVVVRVCCDALLRGDEDAAAVVVWLCGDGTRRVVERLRGGDEAAAVAGAVRGDVRVLLPCVHVVACAGDRGVARLEEWGARGDDWAHARSVLARVIESGVAE